MKSEDAGRPLWHQSGVNRKGEPFVQLLLGEQVIAQLDPDQAREHARAVLESTEASEQDAFLMHWLKTHLEVDENSAAVFLMEFRKWRVEQTGKRVGALHPKDWVMPQNDRSDR